MLLMLVEMHVPLARCARSERQAGIKRPNLRAPMVARGRSMRSTETGSIESRKSTFDRARPRLGYAKNSGARWMAAVMNVALRGIHQQES